MLSKTSIVILGLLHKKNLSAYDMLKEIENRHMKYWFPIGDTTLYETALRLEKKMFIQGQRMVNGKVIYQLTEKGLDELQNAIRIVFLRVDFDTVWFCLAMMFCKVIHEKDMVVLIEQRKALLMEYKIGTTQNLLFMKQNHVPFQGICSIERMLHIIELEQAAIVDLEKQYS